MIIFRGILCVKESNITFSLIILQKGCGLLRVGASCWWEARWGLVEGERRRSAAGVASADLSAS